MKTSEQIVKCPYCGYVADRASEVHDDGVAPVDGDFSLCFGCGGFSVFEASLAEGLRKPDWQEKVEIVRDPDCFRLYEAWRLADALRKAH